MVVPSEIQIRGFGIQGTRHTKGKLGFLKLQNQNQINRAYQRALLLDPSREGCFRG